MRFFGSESQQAMSRRAAALFGLVRDDPRFAWNGRPVVLADYEKDGIDRLESLIRLQGAGVAYWVRREAAPGVLDELRERGFGTDLHGLSVSVDHRSADRAREILRKYRLPSDLTVTRLGPDSPDADLDAMAEVALAEGVLPPPDTVLRGLARRSVVLVAREKATGRPVGCAASIENQHPASRFSDICFWGMLATHTDRRGEKIALVLGAQAMVAMNEENGFRRFMTGIRDDNAASTALCAKFGVERSDYVIVIGMDESAFSDGRVTK